MSKIDTKDLIAMATQALPVSTVKARFSELHRMAGLGFEITAANRHHGEMCVSMVRSDILSTALEEMHFKIKETRDEELGVTTLALEELPFYGEGADRDAAIESLIDAALEYRDVYVEKIELFSRTDSPRQQCLMLKLLRCGDDRAAVRAALGV